MTANQRLAFIYLLANVIVMEVTRTTTRTERICDFCDSLAEYRHTVDGHFYQSLYGGELREDNTHEADLCRQHAIDNLKAQEGWTDEQAEEELDYHGATYM